MNSVANLNVVHESEAQRQHARVKLPGRLRYSNAQRERIDVRLLDVSAGGFSFASERTAHKVGDFHRGQLQFQLDSLVLGLDMDFQVCSVQPEQGRVGCQFHNLGTRETAALRHLISAHLAGELVNVGEVLHILQRENFTKARKNGAGGGMGLFGRLRAVTFSTAIFLVGLAAFGYIGKSIYGLYFVTHAQSAQISLPALQVTMPREGSVQSLVQPDGIVEKGAPIATFTTSMLEMLKGHLGEEQLEPSQIEALFSREMQGTLTSPCNCKIARQLVADGQFASKGDVIFELVPQDGIATVSASFPYRHLEQARPGTPVSFKVAGEDQPRRGEIVSSSLHDGGLSADIRVQIKPEQTLPASLAGQPVDVVIDRGPSLSWLVDRAIAAGR
ncbi:alginate biosynthesis protein Alg44 [Pseudomonas sp. NPDC077649]|jgi:mannuronan synthase|uniref:alginate biosynthesis protein Alg44 n=1 Tax=unclassified Pseudomonas TaxID=196821 RepID=UPI000396960B|nr:alginate biosynthesis protein Alg44 [Pseudomonas sp. EGD-AK9]ERI54214.1 hemolysin D [Pseudomonas sp. EGD-AK9]